MNEEAVVIESPDGWVISIAGMRVVRCSVGFGLEIELHRDKSDAKVQIENGFSLCIGDLRQDIDDQDIVAISSCIPDILMKEMLSCQVSREGVLALEFTGGVVVRVAPDAQYEAWQVYGPHRTIVICTPGGELTIWEDDPGRRII